MTVESSALRSAHSSYLPCSTHDGRRSSEVNMKTEASKDGGSPRPFSFVAVLGCAWPAILLVTVCLLPYLNKPFLVDDPHFLMMAQQIVKHPMHPIDFTLCWNLSPDC